MIRTLSAALLAALLAAAAQAGEIAVKDPYARSANAKSAAAFMTIENAGAKERRLVGVRADISRKASLHTMTMQDGVARMRPVDEIAIPAGGAVELKRGGEHVMFMGLKAPLKDGDAIPMTLIFANGEEIEVEVTVDNAR